MPRKLNVIFFNEGKFLPVASGGEQFKVNLFKYLSQKVNLKVITVSRKYDLEKKLYHNLLNNFNHSFKIDLVSPHIFYSDYHQLLQMSGNADCMIFNDAINMNTIGRSLRQINRAKLGYEAHNINYILSKDLKLKSEIQQLERNVELDALHNADFIFTRSEKDRNDILELDKNYSEKVHVARSGIAYKEIKSLYHLHSDKKFSKIIVFLGHLNYQPNISAVKYILELIAPKLYIYDPEIKVIIAGIGSEKFKHYHPQNVSFIGYVQSLDELLSKSDIALCPLTEGSGTRIKILDYLSRGIPTISTSKGVEGLGEAINNALILENDINKYSSIIIDIYEKKTYRKMLKLSDQSIDFMVKYRSWTKIIDDYFIPIKNICR